MSIKVNISDVRAIMMSNISIFQERKLGVKTMYWLSRLAKELNSHMRIYDEERNKLIMDNCQKNEKGRPVVKEGKFQFANEEKEREVIEKIKELSELEFEFGMDKLKIDINELQGFISASEILLLEPFVEFQKL